jgi:hypothetical protein
LIRGDVLDESEIQELRQVPVIPSLFDAGRLVLVVVVLERLGEADGRQALFDERPVIAAASEAVEPEDETHRFGAGDLLDGPREIPGRGIDAVRASSREDARPVGSARREVRSNDVVVQEAADRVALRFHPLEEPLAAEQALLLAGHRREKQSRAMRAAGEKARALERDCDSRGVVVCAGGIALGIHHRRGHRVVVARDEEDRPGEGRIAARRIP